MRILGLFLLLLAAAVGCAQAADKVNVGILVFEGVQIIDYTGPYETFGHAGYNTFTVAAGRGPLTTAMGLKIIPTYTLAEAPPLDVLVVPGGGVDSAINDPAVLAWIRERTPAAKHVLSVCNGAFILAKTGLLDGHGATTFFSLIPDLREAAPKTKVVSDQRYVDNGKIITTAGLSSGIDGALHVIEVMEGKGLAQRIALVMEYHWAPDEGFARGALADAGLQRLLDRQRPEIPGGKFKLVSTEGDRERWAEQWEIKTAADRAAVQGAIDRYFTETGKWTPRGAGSGGSRAWSFQDENKRGWNATVHLRPAEAGTYRVAIHLERAKA
jgi:putative intracellular protease/amidase